MTDRSKTKEELVKEVQKLRIELEDLKSSKGKDISSGNSLEKPLTRKKFEEALKESETMYRALLEVNILGILAFDVETHQCSFFNSAACKLFGYSPEEITMLNLADFHPKDSIEMAIDEFETQVRGEKPISNSLPCLRKDGTIFYADIAGYSTHINGRNCNIGFIMDVTERRQNEESLHQTRLFLDSIIEHSPNSMWVSDEYGTLIRLNQACRDHLQLKDEEVIGKYNIFNDNLIEEHGFMPMIEDVFRKGLTARFTIQYDTLSVKTLHLERTIKVFLDVHISPIVNSQGKVTNAIIQHNDVTERKMAEQALAESEERYRVLLNGSSYGILAIDIETHRFIFSNPAICKLFGYTDEEFQQLTIENLAPKETLVSVMSEFDLQMRGEKAISFAQECIRKDGTVFYADVAGAPILLNGRNCSVGFFNDVTSRQQAQESLRESESALRQAQEIAKLGSWEYDLINQKVKWSENCYIIYGLKPYELKPTFEYFKSRVHPDDLHIIDETFETISRFKKPINIEVRMLFPEGNDSWAKIIIAPVVIDDKLVALKGVQIDITELKKIEFELIKAKEKAVESDRLKSAFLTNMSHEIRTPMNGILGFSELLKEPKLTGEEQQEYIRIIQKSGKRMLNIIRDLVDISKIEAGQITVVVKESNINEQIEYLFYFFKPEAEKKGIALSIKNFLQSKESIITTDREKIFSILTNLVKNAIKYTKQGSIEFGYEKKGKFLEFFVRDTGIGIPKRRQEAIFDRFVQADIADSNAYEGAGLGLSIAKAYVEMLGGKIWVESSEGEGSTFYFTIP
ncbi:MAG: PAS domain S-box protein, partial [Bacteroidota bacterium]